MNSRQAKASARRNTRDPAQTRASIISSATEEFSTRGVKGARLDAIASRTRTTRAMIYYYFGSKEGLYLAVLETAYRGVREAETGLDLAHLAPIEAMRRLVEFTFDYYYEHPSFVALIVAENQSGGKFIRKLDHIDRMNVSIIDTIAAILQVGALDGVFRAGIDPVEVHMMIAALGLFQIANRHTFGYLFDRDMSSKQYIERTKALVSDVVLRYLSGAVDASVGVQQKRRVALREP